MNKKDPYAQKITYIETAIRKPALARVFFLIMDGVDYNQGLSEAYYRSGRNVRMKQGANPKVLAIHLKELLNAGLVKKTVKIGRIQKYEIDWQGTFEALVVCNKGAMEFGGAYLNSIQDYSRHQKINDGEREGFDRKIEQSYIDEYLKPYFLSKKEELKQAYGYLKIGGKNSTSRIGPFRYPLKEAYELRKKHGTDFCTIPENFDNVDFGLQEEFKTINRLIIGPYYHTRGLVEKYLKKDANKKQPLYWMFHFLDQMNHNFEYEGLNQEDSDMLLTDKVLKTLKDGA